MRRNQRDATGTRRGMAGTRAGARRTRAGMIRPATLNTIVAVLAVAAAAVGLFWKGAKRRPARAVFVSAGPAAGFTAVHHKPVLDEKLAPIMPWVASVGAAAATADFDLDGWVDLYVTDSGLGEPNHLYRNRGDGTFEDVGARAGVAQVNDENGASMDCVWGDYDNDGRPDLFVVQWGRDRLFHNEGDGTFRDVTAGAFRDEAGRSGSPWANGCSAVWLDYNCDGRLDLYVGNYFAPFDLWRLEHTRIMHDSFEEARNAGRNSLFRNNGDGTFTDVAAELGLDDPGWTLSVGHGDINNDGWPDIYCANDFGSDQLFLNEGDGTFRNVTDEALGQDTKKGMNVDFGDVDGNGWLDIYVTNITTAEYLQEGNMLWQNDASSASGVPMFMDVSMDTGTFDGGWGWGAKFFDFDLDGDLDIVSANGFISAGEGSYWYDLASWTVTGQDVTDARNWPPIGDRSFSGYEPSRLWRNDGGMRFAEIALAAGIDDRLDGRGVVAFDSDNDGDLDLFFANQGGPLSYYRNESGGGNHWLELRLLGRPGSGSNRDAVGARVTAVTRSGRQIRELDGGNSYCGQSDRRIHFGLGRETRVKTLEIRWPSRRVQVLRDVRADRILTVEEPAELPAAASLIPVERERLPDAGPAARNLGGSGGAAPALSETGVDSILGGLEARVELSPEDLALSSGYRLEAVRLLQHKRSVRFFERLVERRPEVPNVRLQLACAYVDQIPTCGGMAAVVSKGTLARKSLDQLDALLQRDPSWWPAVYARAMNHLHWPRALRHSRQSAEDFRRCIALQEASGPPGARACWVRAYVGLGDALAKDGDFAGAKEAWGRGLRVFPDDEALRARLGVTTPEAARALVEAQRNLEEPIDTDLSFWSER